VVPPHPSPLPRSIKSGVWKSKLGRTSKEEEHDGEINDEQMMSMGNANVIPLVPLRMTYPPRLPSRPSYAPASKIIIIHNRLSGESSKEPSQNDSTRSSRGGVQLWPVTENAERGLQSVVGNPSLRAEKNSVGCGGKKEGEGGATFRHKMVGR
jgi:hypothetical protein